MKEFIKSDKYGQLYIDKILFESYFPIIFTCVNDDKDIFIGVCCQNNEKGCKWLLGKTNGMSIVKMLQDKITIRRLLLEYSSGGISVDHTENGFIVTDDPDWKEEAPYLPKEDSYMYAEEGEFEEEIDHFSSMDLHADYEREYNKYIEGVLETMSGGIEPVVDPLGVFSAAIGAILIPSEMINTLKVSGRSCTDPMIRTEEYTDKEKYKSVYNGVFDMLSEELSIKVSSCNDDYVNAA